MPYRALACLTLTLLAMSSAVSAHSAHSHNTNAACEDRIAPACGRAPTPAFKEDAPYVLALIDLDDGFRMMMNIVKTPHDAISIGMPVRITFEERDGQKLPQAEGLTD